MGLFPRYAARICLEFKQNATNFTPERFGRRSGELLTCSAVSINDRGGTAFGFQFEDQLRLRLRFEQLYSLAPS